MPLTPGTQTLTFAPEADVRADAALPASNFGTENRLRTDGGSDPDVESFLRFQVAGITGRVTSAKLRLRSITNTSNGPAVRGTTNGWSETGLTWANRPAPTTGAASDAGAIGNDQLAEWDVTALLAADGPLNLHLSQPGNDGLYFHSREASTQSEPPAARGHGLERRIRAAEGRVAAAGLAGARVRALHLAEPRARTAARPSGLQLRPRGARSTSPSAPRTRTAGRRPRSGVVRYAVRSGDPDDARGRGRRGARRRR